VKRLLPIALSACYRDVDASCTSDRLRSGISAMPDGNCTSEPISHGNALMCDCMRVSACGSAHRKVSRSPIARWRMHFTTKCLSGAVDEGFWSTSGRPQDGHRRHPSHNKTSRRFASQALRTLAKLCDHASPFLPHSLSSSIPQRSQLSHLHCIGHFHLSIPASIPMKLRFQRTSINGHLNSVHISTSPH
jgi:hypothetical protein